jgi:hypothetical protein
MAITIRNALTKEVYATLPTLSKARAFCDQQLLFTVWAGSGNIFRSHLAAGVIEVFDAHATSNYTGPGF